MYICECMCVCMYGQYWATCTALHPADYTSCVADPIHTVLTVHWSRGRQSTELRGRKETRGAIGTADTFILSWLMQQSRQQPQHNRNMTSSNQTMMLLQCSPNAAAARAFTVRLIEAYAQSPMPNKHLVTRTHSALSDLSCYKIIVYKTGGERERPWGQRARPHRRG